MNLTHAKSGPHGGKSPRQAQSCRSHISFYPNGPGSLWTAPFENLGTSPKNELKASAKQPQVSEVVDCYQKSQPVASSAKRAESAENAGGEPAKNNTSDVDTAATPDTGCKQRKSTVSRGGNTRGGTTEGSHVTLKQDGKSTGRQASSLKNSPTGTGEDVSARVRPEAVTRGEKPEEVHTELRIKTKRHQQSSGAGHGHKETETPASSASSADRDKEQGGNPKGRNRTLGTSKLDQEFRRLSVRADVAMTLRHKQISGGGEVEAPLSSRKSAHRDREQAGDPTGCGSYSPGAATFDKQQKSAGQSRSHCVVPNQLPAIPESLGVRQDIPLGLSHSPSFGLKPIYPGIALINCPPALPSQTSDMGPRSGTTGPLVPSTANGYRVPTAMQPYAEPANSNGVRINWVPPCPGSANGYRPEEMDPIINQGRRPNFYEPAPPPLFLGGSEVFQLSPGKSLDRTPPAARTPASARPPPAARTPASARPPPAARIATLASARPPLAASTPASARPPPAARTPASARPPPAASTPASARPPPAASTGTGVLLLSVAPSLESLLGCCPLPPVSSPVHRAHWQLLRPAPSTVKQNRGSPTT